MKYGAVLRDVTHYNLVKGPPFSGQEMEAAEFTYICYLSTKVHGVTHKGTIISISFSLMAGGGGMTTLRMCSSTKRQNQSN